MIMLNCSAENCLLRIFSYLCYDGHSVGCLCFEIETSDFNSLVIS